MMRTRTGSAALTLVCVAALTSVVGAQETIFVGHRDNSIVGRIDEVSNTYISGGAGALPLTDLISWPNVSNATEVFALGTSGSFRRGDVQLATLNLVPITGSGKGFHLCRAGNVTEHIAVTGSFSSATSASFLDFVDATTNAVLDSVVSSSLASNWTDVAFSGDGLTFTKYAIADAQSTAAPSSLTILDATAYAGAGTPPYSFPTQMSAMPAGVVTQYTFSAGSDVDVDEYPGTTGRFFVSAYSGWDSSAAAGIQFNLCIRIHNAGGTPGAPTSVVRNFFSVDSNSETFKALRVIGHFAFITETLSGASNSGWLWIVNLRQWEAAGWPSTPPAGVFSSIFFSSTGVDGIGRNIAGNKVYVGSTTEAIGIVYMIPVNLAVTSGTAQTGAQANIVQMTTAEADSPSPPSRPYPKVFSPVNEDAGPGGGGGGGGGGCSASSSGGVAWMPCAFLTVLLLAAAVSRRIAS